MSVTDGAVKKMYDEDKDLKNPVVQVLGIKKISPKQPDKPDRYRLTISDGVHKHGSAMVATQLNKLLVDGHIKENSFIKVTKHLCNTVSDRRIIILLGIEVEQTDVDAPIGTPTSVDQAGKAATTTNGNAKTPAPANRVSTKTSPENPYRKKAAMQHSSARNDDPYVPISALNPYNVKWVIRARVVSMKGRDYTNAKGSGRIFSVDLVDEQGEIRATAFQDVARKLETTFEKNKVYVIKGGRIKAANKRFNNLNNDYEITFDESTTVTEAQGETNLPQQKFNFKSFSDLVAMEVNRDLYVTADVLGVITEVNPVSTIVAKSSGNEMSKRDIVLVDKGNSAINCTLWGDEAIGFEDQGGVQGAVIAIKAAKVSDYNGRSLSVSSQSMFLLNPNIPEAHQLKGWYDSEGQGAAPTSVTTRGGSGGPAPFVTLQQFKDATANIDADKPVSFETTVTCTYIKKENLTYQACPVCNKKVIQEAGGYHCVKCNKTMSEFQYRILGSMSFADYSGSQWMQMFQESGEVLLAATGNEIGTWADNEDPKLTDLLKEATFRSWTLRCRAKAETYNGDTRMRVAISSAKPVDYLKESNRLVGIRRHDNDLCLRRTSD
eukprot:TRINITY_DN7264_c0_g1_i2.p1 TRINITY_DN7264_c0_g1~~TRINITY_DN7264_c0_g1_i2.p1  ORF type:complete len:630 (+),score=196.44 TRINITY_DN7264_c0_g1_i2:74-1891(+)